MALPSEVRRAFRGLHPGDVDRQLIALAEQVQRLDAQNQDLRHELAGAQAGRAHADAARQAAERRAWAARFRRVVSVIRDRHARPA
jgi:hypothetical protein